VEVFDELGSRPVPGATVSISEENNPGNVVEQMITDDSGESTSINLTTPPLDYSLEPGSPRPYADYRVQVQMEGYSPVQVDGVQILPEVTAIQNIYMHPLREAQDLRETVVIPDHTLYGIFPPKIPEEEVKPLRPATGFVVLDEPVIPEFIVVHEGRPSAAAPNRWIPFKDYIKNVASSEIYATWPDATIRANVLCILSFTLNRVFTEWYRGKGYDFTITYSSAYDQAFVYGRNIYSEISQVVDEMFTNYITRPNIRQPLFAQYCDGQRVSCPTWLSQWGSKNLGDSGYNAVSILRNYYGSDIYLMQARVVSGVPVSFPGANLQVGSTGAAVRTIQEQLNTISNNFPALPKLRVDGVFGQATRATVEKFQEVFNLPPSGIVDFPTWYRISDIYTSVARLAEL